MSKTLLKIIKNPVKTIKIINRRYFQFGSKVNDPETNYMKSWIYGNIERVQLNSLFSGIEKVDYTIVGGYSGVFNMSVTLLEINAIVAIERFISAKNVLEIGTFDGGTTVNLAANLSGNGKVTTVDLPPDFTGFSLQISDFNDNKSETHNVGIKYRNSRYVHLVRQIFQDSATVDYKSNGGPFDLIFIDGCHDFEYVKQDTELALANIAKGGVIIWHDYSMIEDVAKYVDSIATKMDIKIVSGTRLAVFHNV